MDRRTGRRADRRTDQGKHRAKADGEKGENLRYSLWDRVRPGWWYTVSDKADTDQDSLAYALGISNSMLEKFLLDTNAIRKRSNKILYSKTKLENHLIGCDVNDFQVEEKGETRSLVVYRRHKEASQDSHAFEHQCDGCILDSDGIVVQTRPQRIQITRRIQNENSAIFGSEAPVVTPPKSSGNADSSTKSSSAGKEEQPSEHLDETTK